MPRRKTLLDQTYTTHFNIYGLQLPGPVVFWQLPTVLKNLLFGEGLAQGFLSAFPRKDGAIFHEAIDMHDRSITMMGGFRVIFETA
jgi:hypothetical protein